MQQQYLSPHDVERDYPGLTADRLARWRWAKVGPEYVAAGKQRLYRREAIEEFLSRNTVVPDIRRAPATEAAR